MAQIGNFGSMITFEVSANRMLPLTNMKRTVSGRWKKHNIIGGSPRSEFQGADSDETTITIILSAEHGIRPRQMIEKIEAAAKSGMIDYLVIGGKRIGSSKVYISSMSEQWNCIWNRGELVKATIDITFSEYT